LAHLLRSGYTLETTLRTFYFSGLIGGMVHLEEPYVPLVGGCCTFFEELLVEKLLVEKLRRMLSP